MCTGGGGSYTTTVEKSDPLPTSVTSVSDASSSVSAEQQANDKQRKKRGISSNYLSSDRGTILGGLNDSSSTGGRQTLG